MKFINELGIGTVNPSACCGGNWISGERAFASVNPARDRPIASVGTCSGAAYEQVMATAVDEFQRWRSLPAPTRR